MYQIYIKARQGPRTIGQARQITRSGAYKLKIDIMAEEGWLTVKLITDTYSLMPTVVRDWNMCTIRSKAWIIAGGFCLRWFQVTPPVNTYLPIMSITTSSAMPALRVANCREVLLQPAFFLSDEMVKFVNLLGTEA